MAKFGTCKECLEVIHIGKCTKHEGYEIWDCPWCDYPHNEFDFLDVWEN